MVFFAPSVRFTGDSLSPSSASATWRTMLVLPGEKPTVAGGDGLALYLLLITGLNDMAQLVWGKMIGR